MAPSGSLRVRTKAIVIQVAIVAGVVFWFKVGWPRIQQERAAAEAARREQRIEFFLQSVVVEAGGGETDAPPTEGAQHRRPQRLRITPPVDKAQEMLGAPDTSMTDFRGGQHLTWIGTRHKLTASFNKGRLYALALTDVQTGHGMIVYESSAQWQQY